MGPRTPPIRLGRIQPREEQRRLGKGDFVIRQGADGIQGGADSVRFPVASGLLRPCRVSIVGQDWSPRKGVDYTGLIQSGSGAALIRSIAKRLVTLRSGSAAISRR